MGQLIKKSFQSYSTFFDISNVIADFLFPPLCLHCQAFITEKNRFFCHSCSPFFDLIFPQERCFYCFCENERKICKRCRKRKGLKNPHAAVWEYFGPVVTFIKKLEKEANPALIKLAASFFIVQLNRLPFPQVDFIVPLPSFWLTTLWNGEHVNSILAKEISRFLNIPCKNILWTNSPKQERFHLKKKAEIEKKTLLLLDLSFSYEKLQHLQEVFKGSSQIVALSLCYKID